jgi:hypothetical protein
MAYAFELWHEKKGEEYDLTKDSTKECTTRQDKKGMQNADLHGD